MFHPTENEVLRYDSKTAEEFAGQFCHRFVLAGHLFVCLHLLHLGGTEPEGRICALWLCWLLVTSTSIEVIWMGEKVGIVVF